MARDKDLDDLAAHLADAQHGAFTLEQVGCDGRVAAQRCTRHEWLRFRPRTFCLPGFLDEWTALAATCLHVPEAVVTGVDAARWWRLEGAAASPPVVLDSKPERSSCDEPGAQDPARSSPRSTSDQREEAPTAMAR